MDEGTFLGGHEQGTYLMLAVQNGQLSIMVDLLEHGAELEAVDATGWTALRTAIESKRDAAVCALLFRGGNRHSKSHDSVSLMSRAIAQQLPELLAHCKTMDEIHQHTAM
jgi:ankyrin repeat protein